MREEGETGTANRVQDLTWFTLPALVIPQPDEDEDELEEEDEL